MSADPETYLTPEQYLEIERRAETKSEYYAGEMFIMAGASRWHNRIVVDVVSDLNVMLRQSDCEPYALDMRVKVSSTGLYTYPDIVVACGDIRFEDSELDTLLNPTLIMEVLSDSTEAYDRGRKFEPYRTLESLQEYILIAQDRPHLELFRRHPNGWVLSEFKNLEDTLNLESIACSNILRDIYRRVVFEDKTSHTAELSPEKPDGI